MHDRIKARAKRDIPAVGKILDALGKYDLPRSVIVDVIRRELSHIRQAANVPEFKSTVALIAGALDDVRASRLQPVINGTGVVIHTNFGRSPLANDVVAALTEIGPTYSNVEYDVPTGERGRRGSYVENALALLCEAEAATVVNNCAAAIVLIVHHFTNKSGRARTQRAYRGESAPEIVISRGELVQIGGGFRIGEMIEATGARLREIGATNKTTLEDYARAIGPATGMILKVHRSNFFMSGFVESPNTKQIAALARKKHVPFVEDLGSGAVVATEEFGIPEHEPTPAETLKHGADLVCFSGDKLFGGAQAGIIAGKKRFIAALKRQPLFRALRCDKLSLAALQATVDLHLSQPPAAIPTLALLRTSEEELRGRAELVRDQLSKQCRNLQVTIGRSAAKAGGGTLPKSTMSSVTINIVPKSCSSLEFSARLRKSTPPLIGYIANDCFKLDLRTIFPQQDDLVIEAIRDACAEPAE
ncbi:MAG TPA: L-seryl-tRNA(Sec) selenium transferase [Candidatus Udaeobacter sp.]|jgi:L-seryl-tRNA(Ser) seleniumtransferase|nr:L-seryl-tRNA(Sec) selenium transferase [Candidatus Udaeobacter sp.]